MTVTLSEVVLFFEMKTPSTAIGARRCRYRYPFQITLWRFTRSRENEFWIRTRNADPVQADLNHEKNTNEKTHKKTKQQRHSADPVPVEELPFKRSSFFSYWRWRYRRCIRFSEEKHTSLHSAHVGTGTGTLYTSEIRILELRKAEKFFKKKLATNADPVPAGTKD
jgi:hypothetical protein